MEPRLCEDVDRVALVLDVQDEVQMTLMCLPRYRVVVIMVCPWSGYFSGPQ